MTHSIPSTTPSTLIYSSPIFPHAPETVATLEAEGIRISIRPGEPAPGLLAVQRSLRVRQWAIISAGNPHGLSISARENERRHGQLRAAAAAGNLQVLEVELQWEGYQPKLQALWIGGIPLHQAQELARDFAQTKLLYGDTERAPSIQTCGALTFEI